MDGIGLDFGFPTEISGGEFAPPPMPQLPSFSPSFNLPEFNLYPNFNYSSMVPSGLTDMNVGGFNFGGPSTAPERGTPPTPEKSTFQKISDYAETAAPILGLGVTAAQIPLQLAQLSQTGRAQKSLEGAVSTERAAAAPGIAAEERLLPAGTEALLSGTLPPELQAAVDDQVNSTKQQMLQQLEQAGIDPVSANAMIETQLQELRTQLTLQYANALMTGGMSAGGIAASSAQAGGVLSAGAASANPLQAANQALARLTASG